MKNNDPYIMPCLPPFYFTDLLNDEVNRTMCGNGRSRSKKNTNRFKGSFKAKVKRRKK
jgi:hypothetical protein